MAPARKRRRWLPPSPVVVAVAVTTAGGLCCYLAPGRSATAALPATRHLQTGHRPAHRLEEDRDGHEQQQQQQNRNGGGNGNRYPNAYQRSRAGNNNGGRSSGGGGGGDNSYYASESRGGHRFRPYYRNRFANVYTHVSDVLACLALALGWLVWMLASLGRADPAAAGAAGAGPGATEAERRARCRAAGVPVRGHVRQVTVQASDLGLPVYRAVVDYMVPPPPEAAAAGPESTGNDKAVAAASLEPSGTGTVPGGGAASGRPAAGGTPTALSACSSPTARRRRPLHVRKEFETDRPLEEGFANVELLVLPEEPTVSVLRGDWEVDGAAKDGDDYYATLADDVILCCRAARCRRLSVVFSGSLVLASIVGAIHVVEHLEPDREAVGWVTVCLGVALLLPAALAIRRGLRAFEEALDFGSERRGVIIDDDTAEEPDLYSVVDGAAAAGVQNITETAGCYFIRLPQTRQRSSRLNGLEGSLQPFAAMAGRAALTGRMGRSSSSVSSISAGSAAPGEAGLGSGVAV